MDDTTKKVRAKFKINAVTQYPAEKYDEALGRSVPDGVTLEVRASPVMGQANKAWSEASPSGDLRLVISNKAAQPFFTPGKSMYLTFVEAPEDDAPGEHY